MIPEKGSLPFYRPGWGPSSAYLHEKLSARDHSADLMISLLPVTAFSAYVLGLRVLAVVITAVIFSVLSELCWQKSFKKKVTVKDLSAAATGMALGLMLSADIPLWMAASGAVFAIMFGKQIFGGQGKTPLNPALAGWFFLQLLFPSAAGGRPYKLFSANYGGLDIKVFAENILNAGQLNAIGSSSVPIEISLFALIAGIIFLLIRKRVQLSCSVMFLAISVLGYLSAVLVTGSPVVPGIMGPVSLFSIFILASDPSISPVSEKGKVMFGTGCGILSVILLALTGEIYSLFAAILVMDALVPFINVSTIPVPFGAGESPAVR